MSNRALKEVPSKGHDYITPQAGQSARGIQKFGTVIPRLSIGIDEKTRTQICEQLNLMLADTCTMRDLYKKSHWQVGGPTFYQLHLLFDKHYTEQSALIDLVAERIQTLGGVTVAMAPDIAELPGWSARRATARRSRCRFPGCWRRMSPSCNMPARWRRGPMSLATTAQTTFWSATSSARMKCRCGSSASIWWRCRW